MDQPPEIPDPSFPADGPGGAWNPLREVDAGVEAMLDEDNPSGTTGALLATSLELTGASAAALFQEDAGQWTWIRAWGPEADLPRASNVQSVATGASDSMTLPSDRWILVAGEKPGRLALALGGLPLATRIQMESMKDTLESLLLIACLLREGGDDYGPDSVRPAA